MTTTTMIIVVRDKFAEEKTALDLTAPANDGAAVVGESDGTIELEGFNGLTVAEFGFA